MLFALPVALTAIAAYFQVMFMQYQGWQPGTKYVPVLRLRTTDAYYSWKTLDHCCGTLSKTGDRLRVVAGLSRLLVDLSTSG